MATFDRGRLAKREFCLARPAETGTTHRSRRDLAANSPAASIQSKIASNNPSASAGYRRRRVGAGKLHTASALQSLQAYHWMVSSSGFRALFAITLSCLRLGSFIGWGTGYLIDLGLASALTVNMAASLCRLEHRCGLAAPAASSG